MNKIFKVIWNEARNAYVVVSEIAKNHGSKSCSTKKLLAMLIATGVMTCASFDVLAAQPAAAKTDQSQYVAFKDDRFSLPDGKLQEIGGYNYIYDATNKYWVREGYVLTVDKNGGKYTPLSENAIRADVAYKDGVAEGILQSVTSTVAHNGVVTHSGDSLQKITAGSYAGVSHGGGTEVAGSWHYIINDSSWENSDAKYKDGYVDLIGNKMPKGFITAGSGLNWDEAKQTYTYKGKAVDYRNMYVIEGELGVFTNADGSEVYTGTVYGKNNEILMTVKDNGKFYSYWAASVTDPSATMETYPVSKYNSDLAVIDKNITDLNKDIIKEVTLTKGDDYAIIKLVRNGGKAVDGAITVTSGGGTGGSGAAHDTFVKISNGTTEQTFATGSKVEVNGPKNAITGIKVNGVDYAINNKVYTAGANVNIDENNVISATDTTYTAGNGIAIDKANAISVKLNKDEKNLVVDGSGLALNTALTGIQSITGAGEGKISFEGATVKVNQNTFNKDGRIQNVAKGKENTDAVNFGQLKETVAAGDTDVHIKAGNYTVDKDNKVSMNLVDKAGKSQGTVTITGVAKAEDVAVVYDKNKTSLRSTNATLQTSSGKEEAVDSIALGNGAGVSVEGGVALGVGSVADRVAGVVGYDPATGAEYVIPEDNAASYVWKATKGAVSVGSGRETRQITNVAAGTEDTDAVNVAQLKKVSEAAANANKGWKVSTNGGTATDVKPGDTVDFAGKDNIVVSNEGTKVSVALKNQLTGIQSITGAGEGAGSISFADGGNVKVNDVTIEKGGKITGVAAGEAGTDAVNVSQLNKVSAAAKTEVVKGTNIASVVETTATDGHKVYTVNAKGTSVSVDGNFNLNTTTDDETNVTNYGISLKDSVTIGGTHAVTINGTDGTVTGLTNTTWNKDSITSGRAATEDQLQAVATEAGKHTTLSNGKNTTVESTVKDGQTDYKVNVASDLTDITSVANGDSKINLNEDSIIISNGNKYFAITNSGIGMSYIGADNSAKSIMLGENGTTISGGLNVAGSKITGVAAGVADTDAVNVGQLNAAVQAGNTDTHIKAGEYGVGTDNNVNMQLVDKNGKDAGTVNIKDVAKASDVGNVNNIASDIKNQDGSHTTVVDAVNNLNQKLDNKVGDLNYVEGGKGNYVTNGENTTTSIGKLDQALKDVADTAAKQHTTVSGSGNIVVEDPTTNTDGGKNYNVKLADDITVNSVTANTFKADQTVMNNDGVKVGKDVSVTATAVTAGKTSISDEGVKVDGKTYISADGLNANDKKVTNVADGKVEKDSKDAINGGQLHQAKADINNRIDGVENQVISNSNRINQLGSRVNKVGAGAAALAALHPMDFDPDDKLTFSAGYGNYGGENAAAIGAYYRPDEKVMFSVGGTVGNGENMVNAGVSFALDRTNHVSNSRTALAREVIDLRGQLAVMGAKMAKMEKALGMLDETKTKLFPDIPANHWAYEYIAKLAGNGYIEGYPDGNFGGDRLMTRYEFAAMLYRAIENGAALEEKIIKEFEPELGRIRVDRISGEDGDRDKIERVRVNDTKGERDHYGNKLAK